MRFCNFQVPFAFLFFSTCLFPQPPSYNPVFLSQQWFSVTYYNPESFSVPWCTGVTLQFELERMNPSQVQTIWAIITYDKTCRVMGLGSCTHVWRTMPFLCYSALENESGNAWILFCSTVGSVGHKQMTQWGSRTCRQECINKVWWWCGVDRGGDGGRQRGRKVIMHSAAGQCWLSGIRAVDWTASVWVLLSLHGNQSHDDLQNDWKANSTL